MSPTQRLSVDIAGLDWSVVPGQPFAATFGAVLPIAGTWTVAAGRDYSVSATITLDPVNPTEFVASWTAEQTAAIVGTPWRARLDGRDKIGGWVRTAQPGAAGTVFVPLEIVVTPSGPAGDAGPSGVIDATAPATYDAVTRTVGVTLGTTAGTVAAGDDARFSDAGIVTAHAPTHATGGTDLLLPVDIGAETPAGAQAKADAAQAYAAARVNHTGEQPQSTVGGLVADLAAKADLVNGLVPTAQIPALAITDTYIVTSQAAMLALSVQKGDLAIRSDIGATFVLSAEPASTLGNWVRFETPTDAVQSVNGQVGTVVLAKADVGLGSVADLAPADLPVSTATGTALSDKVSKTGAETVAGVKTFSSIPVVPDASFAVGKLAGTGTRDVTTFLRGDGTFAAPTAAGGVTELAANQANQTYKYGIPNVVVVGNSTLAVGPERISFQPFFAPFRFSVDSAFLFVSSAGAAGSVGRIGMCRWDWGGVGPVGTPGALVADMGTVAIDSTGAKTATSTVLTQEPGWYAVMMVTSALCTYNGYIVDSPLYGGINIALSNSPPRFARFISNQNTGTQSTSGFLDPIPGSTLLNGESSRYPSPLLLSWRAES